jgi:hypothetical protein
MDVNILKAGAWIDPHFYLRQMSLGYLLLEMYAMAQQKEWLQVLERDL